MHLILSLILLISVALFGLFTVIQYTAIIFSRYLFAAICTKVILFNKIIFILALLVFLIIK